jgi:hypothetical protein
MKQIKEEYRKVKDIIHPRRCGNFRYLPREKRIRKSEKWINQNRADKRLSSFTHNFCRFTSVKFKSNIEAHEEGAKARKLAYFRKRAQYKLAKVGITLFTTATLKISQNEEAEINSLLARLTGGKEASRISPNSYSLNKEDSLLSTDNSAPVNFEGKNE